MIAELHLQSLTLSFRWINGYISPNNYVSIHFYSYFFVKFKMSFIQKKNDVSLEDIARLVGVFSGMNATNVWSKVTAADFTVERFAYVFSCFNLKFKK